MRTTSSMYEVGRTEDGGTFVRQKFFAGQVVRMVGKVRPTEAAKVWVITGVNDKTATLHVLGGDPSGRYMRAPGSMLRVVENPRIEGLV